MGKELVSMMKNISVEISGHTFNLLKSVLENVLGSVWRYPKCWTIPKPILFSGTKYFWYRYRYFLRYQIFPIPVPRLFSDTKFDRYRFRDFFPVPNFSDTGSDTTIKMKNSRYRYLYGTGTHYKSLRFLNFGNENQIRYQISPILVPRLFSGTKFCRYRFRDFFPVPICSDTGSDTTKKINNSRYWEFPVPVGHTLVPWAFTFSM